MEASQRRVISLAAYLVAAILFLFDFGRPLWEWATWNESRNTVDLGFVKISSRPAFPGDGRAIGLGLILPIVIGAGARAFEMGRKA
jgi:hypothetical protein